MNSEIFDIDLCDFDTFFSTKDIHAPWMSNKQKRFSMTLTVRTVFPTNVVKQLDSHLQTSKAKPKHCMIIKEILNRKMSFRK